MYRTKCRPLELNVNEKGRSKMEELHKFVSSFENLEFRQKLELADYLLSLFLVTPLIVLFWHGSFGLLDIFLLDYAPHIGAWMLLIFGLGIQISSSVCQKIVPRCIPKDPDLTFIIGSRIYNGVIAFGGVCHMRGLTDLYFRYQGDHTFTALRTVLTAATALGGIQCSQNLLGPPVFLQADVFEEDLFQISTIFQTEPKQSTDCLLDNIASFAVVHSLVHLYWAGVWTILDNICFPRYPFISMAVCLISGTILLIYLLYLQKTGTGKQYKSELQKTHHYLGLFYDSFISALTALACVMVWRSYWLGFDFLAENYPIRFLGLDLTYILSFVVSFALLVYAHCTNTLSYKGCDLDSNDLQFEVSYFTEFLSIDEHSKDNEKDKLDSSTDGTDLKDTKSANKEKAVIKKEEGKKVVLKTKTVPAGGKRMIVENKTMIGKRPVSILKNSKSKIASGEYSKSGSNGNVGQARPYRESDIV